mmetsp:Transcript_4548/g.6078  ORF Transcript_4548/g.6078 Transcript_4548/m.6078 type:complete len:491 (-) Transcript_4548:124-1596(-)
MKSSGYRYYRFLTSSLEYFPGLVHFVHSLRNRRVLQRIESVKLPEAAQLTSRQRVLNPSYSLGSQQRVSSTSNTTLLKPVWFHAASLGECFSILPIVELHLNSHKANTVVITCSSGSALSVFPVLLKEKWSNRATCQLCPLDFPTDVDLFLEVVDPCLAIWVESELWPNLINSIHKRGTPLVLLNATLSQRSQERWNRYRIGQELLAEMLECFDLISCKRSEDAVNFRAISGKINLTLIGDLKSLRSSHATTTESEIDSIMKNLLSEEKIFVWIVASTHQGEEEVIVQVHQLLKNEFEKASLGYQRLLTILAPRHPERSETLHAYLHDKMRLSCVLRSSLRGKDSLEISNSLRQSEILILDSLGELSKMFKYVETVFVGASLSLSSRHGGHNAYEPFLEGVNTILHGPKMVLPDELTNRTFIVDSPKSFIPPILSNITRRENQSLRSVTDLNLNRKSGVVPLLVEIDNILKMADQSEVGINESFNKKQQP